MSAPARHAVICPHCAKVNDMHTSLEDADARPSNGDALLCIGCGKWGIYDNGASRMPTADELVYLTTDAECIRYALAWHAMMDDRMRDRKRE